MSTTVAPGCMWPLPDASTSSASDSNTNNASSTNIASTSLNTTYYTPMLQASSTSNMPPQQQQQHHYSAAFDDPIATAATAADPSHHMHGAAVHQHSPYTGMYQPTPQFSPFASPTDTSIVNITMSGGGINSNNSIHSNHNTNINNANSSFALGTPTTSTSTIHSLLNASPGNANMAIACSAQPMFILLDRTQQTQGPASPQPFKTIFTNGQNYTVLTATSSNSLTASLSTLGPNSSTTSTTGSIQQQQQQQQHGNAKMSVVAGCEQQNARRPSADVQQWGYAVVDQLHTLLPRIPVPPSAIVEHTLGIAQYNSDVVNSSTRPCTSMACLQFGHGEGGGGGGGGCPLGPQCTAFHISPQYLALSRALHQPLCCALHNCFYSQEMLNEDCVPDIARQRYCIALDNMQQQQQQQQMMGGSFTTNISSNSGLSDVRLVEVSVLHLSLSAGVLMLPNKDGRRVISLRRRICRLHLEGKCKWTKDCGHVHVCRTLLPLLSSPAVLALLDAIQTEDRESLIRRIQASDEAQRYVSSVSVLPLLSQLIHKQSVEAIAALVHCGAVCTARQAEAIRAMDISPRGSNSSSTSCGAANLRIVQVSSKVEKILYNTS